MELLKDLTVLSLEQATVLPYLTFRLAQDGMNVIRLEHPVYGDPNRFIGDNVLSEERMNAYFLCINAGKKALTLNLAEDEGRTLIQTILQSTATLEPTDQELRVTLSPLSSPHRSQAVAALCENLNTTETCFPGTDLRMRFAVAGYPK